MIYLGRTTLEEIKFVLRQVYAKRGYLVIGQPPLAHPYKLGDTTTKLYNLQMDSQFQVVSKTGEEDWNAQWDLVQELRPGWQRLPKPAGALFFRVKATQKQQGAV